MIDQIRLAGRCSYRFISKYLKWDNILLIFHSAHELVHHIWMYRCPEMQIGIHYSSVRRVMTLIYTIEPWNCLEHLIRQISATYAVCDDPGLSVWTHSKLSQKL